MREEHLVERALEEFKSLHELDKITENNMRRFGIKVYQRTKQKTLASVRKKVEEIFYWKGEPLTENDASWLNVIELKKKELLKSLESGKK